MFAVIKRQRHLLRYPVPEEVQVFRLVLFGVSLCVLFGNIIPIVIDVLTIASHDSLQREDSPSTIGIVYAFSNTVSAIIASMLIWLLYRLAARTADITDENQKAALRLSDKNVEEAKRKQSTIRT